MTSDDPDRVEAWVGAAGLRMDTIDRRQGDIDTRLDGLCELTVELIRGHRAAIARTTVIGVVASIVANGVLLIATLLLTHR